MCDVKQLHAAGYVFLSCMKVVLAGTVRPAYRQSASIHGIQKVEQFLAEAACANGGALPSAGKDTLGVEQPTVTLFLDSRVAKRQSRILQ